MDKKHSELLHKISDDVFSVSLLLDRDSIERDLLFDASQLIEMALKLLGEKEDA